jgi:hypothetical protein
VISVKNPSRFETIVMKEIRVLLIEAPGNSHFLRNFNAVEQFCSRLLCSVSRLLSDGAFV